MQKKERGGHGSDLAGYSCGYRMGQSGRLVWGRCLLDLHRVMHGSEGCM